MQPVTEVEIAALLAKKGMLTQVEAVELTRNAMMVPRIAMKKYSCRAATPLKKRSRKIRKTQCGYIVVNQKETTSKNKK